MIKLFFTLQILGDKLGWFTASHLSTEVGRDLLKQLEDKFNVRAKFIHVVRNPFDNISTMALRLRGLRSWSLTSRSTRMLTQSYRSWQSGIFARRSLLSRMFKRFSKPSKTYTVTKQHLSLIKFYKNSYMNTLVESFQNAIAILGLQWSVGKIWEHVRH